MAFLRVLGIVFFFGLSLASQLATAADSTAPVVRLRSNCSENGIALNNCFTSLGALTTWIWSTRLPSPAAPLIVEIGPGTFNGTFSCSNSGYVTLRGSGPLKTKIQAGQPIRSTNCTELEFEDLTISGDGSSFTLIFWNGGGTSRWSNVDLVSHGYGWIEGGCAPVPGQHYFFGSRIVAYSAFNSLRNYIGSCDVTWFIGSEITSIANLPTSSLNALVAQGRSEMHVYGSVIRAISGANISTGPVGADANGFVAISASGSGAIHIHGSAIDAISDSPNQVAVLSAETGGTIHANQTSYNIKAGNGATVWRIKNFGGHIHAPYQWEAHGDPPFSNSPGIIFNSTTGSDSAITTNTADGHPHLIIYDESCASRWFDIVTKACK